MLGGANFFFFLYRGPNLVYAALEIAARFLGSPACNLVNILTAVLEGEVILDHLLADVINSGRLHFDRVDKIVFCQRTLRCSAYLIGHDVN